MAREPVRFAATIDPEDRLRADFYALFARLLIAPPDAELLRMIGTAPLLDAEADGSALANAWARLSAAARVMDPDAAADEFDALFGGIGKTAVSLFGSYYVGEKVPGMRGNFLVELREMLATLGLGLQTGQNMPEDHLSVLFETMRLLIAGDSSLPPRDIATQRAFFTRFIAPWQADCCAAIANSNLANFFVPVAECLSAFKTIENESVEIA
jgi:TorA maturation chaperone TorD